MRSILLSPDTRNELKEIVGWLPSYSQKRKHMPRHEPENAFNTTVYAISGKIICLHDLSAIFQVSNIVVKRMGQKSKYKFPVSMSIIEARIYVLTMFKQ